MGLSINVDVLTWEIVKALPACRNSHRAFRFVANYEIDRQEPTAVLMIMHHLDYDFTVLTFTPEGVFPIYNPSCPFPHAARCTASPWLEAATGVSIVISPHDFNSWAYRYAEEIWVGDSLTDREVIDELPCCGSFGWIV